MIHIYHGDGKGKSTAAFGLAVRAAGSGFNVIIAQFLKSRDVGELRAFSKMDSVTLIRANIDDVFTYQMTDAQKSKTLAEHNALFQKVVRLGSGKNICKKTDKKTLIIFDEIIDAINEKIVDEDAVLDFLRQAGKDMEIVLTGRNPSEQILKLGDYITEMRKIKHPYDSGAKMRQGIEY